MQDKKGIDIAKWNKITNYQSVKSAGVKFAIVKVINASNKPDGRFYNHVAGCNSVGLPIIAGYTYSYTNTEDKARKAADAFVEVGAPKGIDTMVLDLEDASMMHLGSKIVKIIDIYRQTAQSAGMDFLIYTGGHFYNPCLKPYIKEIKDIPIWWARYPSTRDKTITASVPDDKYLPEGIELCGWQYSSKGVVNGIVGYVDLNVWYRGEHVVNIGTEITPQYNPFTEPISNVKLGTMGNDANWVQWYLWRFGKYVDAKGQADSTKIDGIIGIDSEQKIKEVQALLGLDPDGIVGKITRATWKKIC